MNIMQLLNSYEVHSKEKSSPDGMLVLEWTLNLLGKDISLASSICRSSHFNAAEGLIKEAQNAFNHDITSFDEIIIKLREALTKVTTEGAHAAETLF